MDNSSPNNPPPPPPPPPPVPTSPKMKEQAPHVVGVPDTAPINMEEASKVAKEEGDEYWENYAREIELEKEILEMGGVEKVEAGEVKVGEKIAKEMGIKPVTTIQTPMGLTGYSVRGISLSDSQLTAGAAKPASSGFKWLVEWFIYQLLKAHFLVKRVKGQVSREKQ